MPIYLKMDGIDGSVTAAGHEEWIDCGSFQYGVGRAITNTVGSQHDREASQPSISEITVTKEMDKTSPLIFNEATVGKAKKVEIHLCKTGTDSIETYAEYVLEDCMVSGYSCSSGGDRPSESISLSFAKLTTKYIPFDQQGAAGSPVPAGYDLTQGKKI